MLTVMYYNPAPQSVQGNSGTGWYIPTGNSTYSPDGSIAWEFRDPYDTEPAWITIFQQPTVSLPAATPQDPRGLNPPLVWPTAEEPPVYVPPPPVVVIPPAEAAVPEPSARWLMVFALVIVCIVLVRRSDRRRWGG